MSSTRTRSRVAESPRLTRRLWRPAERGWVRMARQPTPSPGHTTALRHPSTSHRWPVPGATKPKMLYRPDSGMSTATTARSPLMPARSAWASRVSAVARASMASGGPSTWKSSARISIGSAAGGSSCSMSRVLIAVTERSSTVGDPGGLPAARRLDRVEAGRSHLDLAQRAARREEQRRAVGAGVEVGRATEDPPGLRLGDEGERLDRVPTRKRRELGRGRGVGRPGEARAELVVPGLNDGDGVDELGRPRRRRPTTKRPPSSRTTAPSSLRNRSAG